MNRTLGAIFKVLGFLAIIGLIVGAFYFTKILSSNRATVKDMSYNLEKSKKVYLDTPEEEMPYLQTTVYPDGNKKKKGETERYIIKIKDIELESLNTKTDEIIKGQDYYLFYTVEFTALDNSFVMTELDDLGSISSVDWKYTQEIPQGESKSNYDTIIKKGETRDFKFYIKTNEPVENLGFYVTKKIDKNIYKQYHPLKKGYDKKVDALTDKEKEIKGL